MLGARNALAVAHCTGALHLALFALGIGPGDEVITTPFTFTATAEVMGYPGAHPFSSRLSLIPSISIRPKSSRRWPAAIIPPAR